MEAPAGASLLTSVLRLRRDSVKDLNMSATPPPLPAPGSSPSASVGRSSVWKRNLLISGLALVVFLAAATLAWLYLSHNQYKFLTSQPEHGVCYTFELEDANPQGTNAVPDFKAAIGKRFSKFGSSIFWEGVSPTRFRVYAPILDREAAEAAAALVSQRGALELRVVHLESLDLISKNITPPGYAVFQMKTPLPSSTNYYVENYLLSRKPETNASGSGIRVRQAMATQDSRTGAYEIYFKLTPESAKLFKRITRDLIGRQLAIVVDGEMLSAPVIRSEIGGGEGVISGSFERIQAVRLATLLEIPLPVPVKVLESKSF